MAKKVQLATGLDAGSSCVRLAVCSVEDETIRYLAHAEVPSRGWRRGVIADQAAAAECIREAARIVEAATGEQIASAVVGAGGPSVRSHQARGLYEFGGRRPIERGDLVYSIELASRARLEDDRYLLQVLPQDFTVDGKQPMSHPLNVECARLEAHALLISISAQEHQALASAIHQAHLNIEETIFEPMAAAYASIYPEERAGGVAVVDIGAQSTGVVMYDGEAMLYAVGMPVSGEHFTRDLGELKALSYDEAERLKIAHGCCLLGLTADNIVIELPAEQGRPTREISRREMIEILQSRAADVFDLVEARRARLTRELQLREGVVLTGGGAQLEGMVEVAEKVMNCPARLGFPRGIEGWPEELQNALWTTAAGLSMYSGRLQSRQVKKTAGPSFWKLFTAKG